MKTVWTLLLVAGGVTSGTAQQVEKKAVENTKVSLTVDAQTGRENQAESSVKKRALISVTEQVKPITSSDKKTEFEYENPNQYKTLTEAAMTPVRNHQPIPHKTKNAKKVEREMIQIEEPINKNKQ